MQIAIECGNVEILDILCQYKIYEEELINLFFLLACGNDNIDVVKYLATRFADSINVCYFNIHISSRFVMIYIIYYVI
jgi:hypothetical protein